MDGDQKEKIARGAKKTQRKLLDGEGKDASGEAHTKSKGKTDAKPDGEQFADRQPETPIGAMREDSPRR